jgi:ATP-dependent RNA helicase DHX33
VSSVALQLLAMGITDIVNFDFMDKPSTESILKALEELELLSAIQLHNGKPKLTEVGRKMAAFPLDPRMAKTILAAKDYDCLEEILTVMALLFVDSVIHLPQHKREEALAAHRKFISSDGDHITLLNIYRAYKSVNGNKDWCMENFINVRNMKQVMEVRKQLQQICVRQELPFKSCGRDTTAIRKCLTVGFFMNTAELQKEGQYTSVSRIH